MVGRKKAFKHFDIEERLRIMDAIVNIFSKYKLPLFSSSVDKRKLQEDMAVVRHPHRIAFGELIKQIDKFLEEQDEYGLIIMDKNQPMEQIIVNDFSSYKVTSYPLGLDRTSFAPGTIFTKRLVDTVYYTESHNSNLMQLSDVI